MASANRSLLWIPALALVLQGCNFAILPETGPAYNSWEGAWTIWVSESSDGPTSELTMTLQQPEDGPIKGRFVLPDGATAVTLEGTSFVGNDLILGTWDDSDNFSGTFEFIRISDDQFMGARNGDSAWCGARNGAPQPDPCYAIWLRD